MSVNDMIDQAVEALQQGEEGAAHRWLLEIDFNHTSTSQKRRLHNALAECKSRQQRSELVSA